MNKNVLIALTITLTGLGWSLLASAQNVVINDDCIVELDPAASVTFQANGDISLTTATPIPSNCVDAPPIGGGGAVALSVTPATVEASEPFTISYAVPAATPAYSCTIRAGQTTVRTDAQITRPTGSLTEQTVNADTTYTLSCTRNVNQGTETSSATALVDFVGQDNPPPPPQGSFCAQLPNGERLLAAAAERNNAPFGSVQTYADMFGTFPLSESNQSSTYRVFVARGTYLSLPFTVPSSAADNATITLTWEDSSGGSSSTIVSVSSCIGGVLSAQTVPQAAGGFCQVVGSSSGGNLRIGVDPALANCVLQRGQTYYLNVMDYSEATSSTTCPNSECTWLVQVQAIGAVP